MFREMRRQDRCITKEEAFEILARGKYGVLSVVGEDGYPYGVPMHYIVEGNSVYLHCSAQGGHRNDALENNPKISFTVIETENGIQCKSIVLFGKAVMAAEKKTFVLEKLVEKFVPEPAWESAKKGIPFAVDSIQALELKIEHITGKWIDKPEGR